MPSKFYWQKFKLGTAVWILLYSKPLRPENGIFIFLYRSYSHFFFFKFKVKFKQKHKMVHCGFSECKIRVCDYILKKRQNNKSTRVLFWQHTKYCAFTSFNSKEKYSSVIQKTNADFSIRVAAAFIEGASCLPLGCSRHSGFSPGPRGRWQGATGFLWYHSAVVDRGS